MTSMNTASLYFNENWARYQSSLKNNSLYHREMMTALDGFLAAHMNKPFSLVDVGCGDGSTVVPVLAGTKLTQYIGIDEAEAVLKMASDNFAAFKGEKKFIAENMTTAIPGLSEPVDIIYTSYAVHHLSLTEKIRFIGDCKQKLKPGGFLLMIDGVLAPHQTRAEWLNALQARLQETHPDQTASEIETRMQHPRVDDFPESLETFAKIARQQAWKNFHILVDKGIFAFMVFTF